MKLLLLLRPLCSLLFNFTHDGINSICTCSRDGGLGFGAATTDGALGLGFEGTVDGRTSGVSGAKVVAGEDGIDDAKPGNTIGKSEMLK